MSRTGQTATTIRGLTGGSARNRVRQAIRQWMRGRQMKKRAMTRMTETRFCQLKRKKLNTFDALDVLAADILLFEDSADAE